MQRCCVLLLLHLATPCMRTTPWRRHPLLPPRVQQARSMSLAGHCTAASPTRLHSPAIHPRCTKQWPSLAWPLMLQVHCLHAARFPTVCVCMCWIVEQGSHICLAFCAVPMEMCGVEVCPQGDCAAATMQAATTFSKLAVTTGTWAGGRCMSIDVLTSQVPSCNLRHIHSGWWPSDASGWLQCLLHPATTHSRRVLHDPNGNRPVRDHCVARQQQRGTHQPCRDIPHVSRAACIGF